jgi:asparagine synthase (glutamine-hydrolysing)
MAHGVEVRSPFLDHRLVSYSFSLPSIAKQGGGYTKRILRESMKNILPENIRTRTSKIGFSSPIEEWYNSPLKEFIVDSINSKEFIESDIWNGPIIKGYLEKAYERKNYKGASNTWKYIQAMILIRSFDSFSKSFN